MMVIAVGLSSYNLALFHLVNHAFYKGLLFLGAGAVIHAWADNQDFRRYGGLRPFLPLTYSVMLIASLSLVAFPFMTGFYSKDFILESTYGQFYFSSTVVYFIATIGAMFTTLYSVKILYLTFLTNPNGPLINYKQVHEGDTFMSVPLIILAIFSIFFGYLTKDIFIGLGSNFFADNSLFIHPTHEIMLDTEFAVHSLFKLLPLIFTISLTAIFLVLSEFYSSILISFKFSRTGYNIFSFFNQRFLIEFFYNKYITGILFKLGGQTTKVLDKGSVELVGPFGLEKVLVSLSRNISSLDTGVITSYALYILIGLISYTLMPYVWLTNSSLLLLIMFSLSITINLNKNKISNNNITSRETFVSLPLQSSFITSALRRITIAGFISGFISLVLVLIFKFYYFGGFSVQNHLDLIQGLKLGTLFLVVKQIVKVFIIEYIEGLECNWTLEQITFWLDINNIQDIIDLLKYLGSSNGNGGGEPMHMCSKSPELKVGPKTDPFTSLSMESHNPERESSSMQSHNPERESSSSEYESSESDSPLQINGFPKPDKVTFTEKARQAGDLTTRDPNVENPRMYEYMGILNEATDIRDRYTMSLRKFCVKAFDEHIPFASLKAETDYLIKLDGDYKKASKEVKSRHHKLHPNTKDEYPLRDSEKYNVNTAIGLPPTNIIKNILRVDKQLNEMARWAESQHGATDRAQLLDLQKRGLIPPEDRTALQNWDSYRYKKDKFWKLLEKVNADRDNDLGLKVASDAFKKK